MIISLTFLDVIGHLSFGLTALSFWVRDMVLLRGLAIASGIVGVAYNYLIPAGPLWLVIFWLTVFVAINLVRIVGLILERRDVDFTEDEAELYETIFKSFSQVEFMKLMRLANWSTADEGTPLARENQLLDDLILIYNGAALVAREGAVIARVKDGAMIGEISYLRGGTATATVTTTNRCRLVTWHKAALRDLLRRNPSMDIAMRQAFSLDMTRKLAEQSQD